MIWFRRFIAVFLSVIFLPVFLVTLVVLRVNDTALAADFYVEQLRKADVFNFLYDEVIPAAIDEVGQGEGDPPPGLDLARDVLVVSMKKTFPPEWLQEQSEDVITQMVPYLVGDKDGFTLSVDLAGRLEALGGVVKSELDGNYDRVFDEVITPPLEEYLQENELPMGITVESQSVVDAVQEVVPPDWIQARVEHVVDQLVPYIRGDVEHFTINLPIADRLEAAVPAAKRLLREVDAYNVVFDEVVSTLVTENISQFSALPFGVTVTNEEIEAALRDVLPPQFIQEQAEAMIDELVPWVTGAQNGFVLIVPLEQRKDAMLGVVDALVNQKIQELADSLPACSVAEALDLVQTGFSGLIPSCRPTGYTLDEIKQALGISIPGISEELIEEQLGVDLSIVTEGVTVEGIQEAFGIDVLGPIRALIVDALPDDYTYTEDELRDTLSTNDEQTLDDALEWVRNGITYSDTELRDDVGPGGAKDLDRALRWLQQGFTEADLRDLVTDDGADPQALDDFDRYRNWLGLARSLWFLLGLLPLLLLAAVGFLGGRRWRSRAAWAAVLLLFAAGMAYIASGPGYSAFAKPLIDDEIAKAAQDKPGIGLLMVNKSTDIASSVVEEFVSGLEFRSLVLMVVAAAVLVLSTFWSTLFGRGVGAQPQPSPGGEDAGPAQQAGVSLVGDRETEEPLLEQETDQAGSSPDDVEPPVRGQDDDREGGG